MVKDIQVEMTSRYLDMGVWSLEERSGAGDVNMGDRVFESLGIGDILCRQRE